MSPKPIMYSPDELHMPTWVFQGQEGKSAEGAMCSYCQLTMGCEIFLSLKAMERTFIVVGNIVECPRYIPKVER